MPAAPVGPEFLLLGTRQDQGSWTVTVSPAADPSFPAANILQPGYSAVYQSLPGDTAITLTIDRGASPPSMAGIALAGVNINSESVPNVTFRASALSDFSVLILDLTVSAIDLSSSGTQPRRAAWGDLIPIVFPVPIAARYFRFIFASSSAPFLRIGAVTGSGFWQASANFDIDMGAPPEGAVRAQVMRRDPRYTFLGMTIASARDLSGIFEAAGTSARFVWVPIPADRSTYPTTAGYGTFKEAPRENSAPGSGGAYRTTSLALIESTG